MIELCGLLNASTALAAVLPNDDEVDEFFQIKESLQTCKGATDMGIQIGQMIALMLTITLASTVSSMRERYAESDYLQCSNKSDVRYERQALLAKLDSTLKNSIPAYSQFSLRGFFVYDLNDPTNKYIPAQYAQADACISFINNHVYHFAPIEFAFSQSHFAVLKGGELKVFKSINCKDSKEHLTDVVAFVKKRLKKDGHREDLLTRMRNYRTYGFYMNTDSPRVPCEVGEEQRNP
jgi:hypothetical protein